MPKFFRHCNKPDSFPRNNFMDQFAKETISISLEEEMRKSYLDYAMSVIVGRALPDVRDGLKPVHRRVLFGMHEMNNSWNRPYVKCARVVGEVMGKYHPHGDQSIYDTLSVWRRTFPCGIRWWTGKATSARLTETAPPRCVIRNVGLTGFRKKCWPISTRKLLISFPITMARKKSLQFYRREFLIC